MKKRGKLRAEWGVGGGGVAALLWKVDEIVFGVKDNMGLRPSQ